MLTKTIKLSKIQDVYDFVRIVTAFDEEIDITSGKYRVNAKSIMGIFALDLSQPLNLEIHSDDCDKLLSDLAPYLI